LLAGLGVLAILAGLFLPAVQKVREAAARTQSMNNMKQIGLAVHNYHDVNGNMPSGSDANGFSAHAVLLPFIEQDNLFKLIDFTKTPDAQANAQVRASLIKVFISPRDPEMPAFPASGPTNYMFSAGSKAALKDNDGAFFTGSKVKLVQIPDGTSNTIMTGETLRGDGGTKPVTVQRQHVLLKAGDLQQVGPDTGTKEWKAGKNVVGTRGSSWIEGRFLQTMFTGTLKLNDPRPDVDCGGAGGESSLRSLDDSVLVGMCDGSIRALSAKRLTLATWQNAVNTSDGNVLGPDF
jgi:hypothetical protein